MRGPAALTLQPPTLVPRSAILVPRSAISTPEPVPVVASTGDTVPLIIWSVDAGALHDGVGALISVNDASTVDDTSICDGGGSWFDGIDASIGDNNASASDIMASIPVDAGALITDLAL